MKKLLSLLLTAVMFFNCGIIVFAADTQQKEYSQKFWDVPKDYWAFFYIAELVDKGVLAGYEDGSFRPENTVTRAEWAKIMVLAAGLPVKDNNVYFTDMINHWANTYVNTAKDYLAAYTDGSFKPDQAAVREDVTVSMVKLKGYDVNNVDYSYLNQFTDTNSISNSLKAYVAIAVEKDLIDGFDDNTFRGQNTLTRAEAATLLWRAFQYGNDNKVVDTPDTPLTAQKDTQTQESTQKPQTSETTPKPAQESQQAIEPEKEKPYIIDTLKQVKIDSNDDFTYDGDQIYYIDGKDIYSLDPYSGDTSVIYSTDNLILQKTETQEREVTKTVTVEPEDTETEAEEVEDTEEQTEEITEEPTVETITETITEEVVVEEYSDYTPTQIKYDPYNDRLIMTGYFKNAEVAFEAPNNNARYFVSYDISNDEVFWEFENYNNPSFMCFISKDKAVCYNSNGGYNRNCIVNTDTKKEIDGISFYNYLYNVGNSLYARNNYGYLYQYDFSSNNFENIFKFPSSYCAVGVNGEDLYYWNGEAVFKLNLTSGKASELSINSDSEYCDVLDMAGVSTSKIESEFIPVSDTYFVFYDKSLGAFRTLSER